MSSASDRRFGRLAVAGALVAALALGGCGRKAGLDLPPSATAQQTAGAPNDTQGIGPDGRPVAPAGQKKRIILDTLLD